MHALATQGNVVGFPGTSSGETHSEVTAVTHGRRRVGLTWPGDDLVPTVCSAEATTWRVGPASSGCPGRPGSIQEGGVINPNILEAGNQPCEGKTS